MPVRYDHAGNPIVVSRESQPHTFRYFSVDAIASSSFHGGIDEVNSGAGISISVPPFLPIGVAITTFGTIGGGVVGVFSGEYIDMPTGDDNPLAVIVGAINTGLIIGNFGIGAVTGFDATSKTMFQPNFLTHGVRDTSNRYISDVSLDLSYSFTSHEDALGGYLHYHSILFGGKLASPAWYVPKYYLRGGLGMHYFWFSDRPDESTPGLFLAVGVEAQSGRTTTLGVEYMTQYYVGNTSDAIPAGSGANQFVLSAKKYF